MVGAADLGSQLRQRIAERMTRIAVVTDKQEVLFAMRGDQLRALNFYQEGHTLSETATLLDGKSQLTTLFIPFGRFKKDREYMLDMGKFCGLTLEITNDIVAAISVDGQTSVDIQLVEAQDFGRVPVNYLKHWEYTRQKPVAAGQDLLIELPSADPIKTVIAQMIPDLDECNKPTADPISDTSRLVMTLQGDKLTVWDMRPKDIGRENAIEYGRPRADGKYHTSQTWNWDNTIGYVENMVDHELIDEAGGASSIFNEDSQDRFQHAAVIAADHEFQIKATAVGIAYWHTLMLWDSLRANGNDPLGLVCGCNKHSPAVVKWMATTADHYFATIIGTIVAQGKS